MKSVLDDYGLPEYDLLFQAGAAYKALQVIDVFCRLAAKSPVMTGEDRRELARSSQITRSIAIGILKRFRIYEEEMNEDLEDENDSNV